MVRYTLKILQQMQQDFKSVSDYSRTIYIKGLRLNFSQKNLSGAVQVNNTLPCGIFFSKVLDNTVVAFFLSLHG